MELVKVNLKSLRKLLPHYFEKKFPLYLWGKPSTGKSSAFRDFAIAKAKELGLEFSENVWGEKLFTFQVTYLSQMDAPDLIGLPSKVRDEDGNETTCFIPSDIIPRRGQGVWLLDEMNHADQTIRSAANQFVLDRKYHNIILPDGVWVVAASNSEQDFCEVNPTPLNITSRFKHIEVQLDLEEFIPYLLEKRCDPRIVAYLRNFPQDLFPKEWSDKLVELKANPFPRQWDDAGSLIKDSKDWPLLHELVGSCVGPAVASRFVAFCKTIGKLDTNKVIEKPEEEILRISKSEDRASLLYAVISNLAAYWFNKNKKLTAKKVVEIAALLESKECGKAADFAVAFMKLVLKKRYHELTALKELYNLLNRLGVYFDDGKD